MEITVPAQDFSVCKVTDYSVAELDIPFCFTGSTDEEKSPVCPAENGIGIFAVSTYNTDYIFTKSENFSRALSVLAEQGYTII